LRQDDDRRADADFTVLLAGAPAMTPQQFAKPPRD
jgi:hypothetical protein